MTHLYYSINDLNGSDIMQTFLISCEIHSGISCPYIYPCDPDCPSVEGVLIDERSISSQGSFQVLLPFDSGLYKICSRLKNNPNYDCGGDNYFILLNKDVIVQTKTEYVYENITNLVEVEEPSINIYSIPTNIVVGQEFEIIAYINNPTNETLSVKTYTFAYNEGECVTNNCWDDYEIVTVNSDNSERVVFNNSFLLHGNFTFKARASINNKTFTDSLIVNVMPKEDIRFYFLYNNTHIGYKVKKLGGTSGNISAVALYEDVMHKTYLLEPSSEIQIFFEREEGWVYLFNQNELLDSRAVWEYKSSSSINPTGFYVANPNDLNIPLVLISLIGLAYLVWKI